MSKVRKRYDAKTKFQVVIELLKWRKTQAQITTEYWVHTTQQNNRKDEFMRLWPSMFEKDQDTSVKDEQEKQIENFHKVIGQQSVEIDWLKKKIAKL